MKTSLVSIERKQRVALRRIERNPEQTAALLTKALSRRALILIGIGIAVGSALGGAGMELARMLLASTLKLP